MKKPIFSDAQITAMIKTDFERVAIHELAHSYVADSFGVIGHIRYTQNENIDSANRHLIAEQNAITGRFEMWNPPIDRFQLAAIGLAGTIAESVCLDEDITADDVFNHFICEDFSETDAALVPDDFNYDEVESCIELVKQLKPKITAHVALDVKNSGEIEEAINRILGSVSK